MQAAPARPSRLYAYLALTTALLTLGLIVFGAVVRVTDSGLGCGNEWPTCHGSLIPPLDNITAVIEWLHRAFAVFIGLFGIVTLIQAVRAFRRRNRLVLMATLTAALLFAAQSMLGALVVILDLPPTAVTLHLGTAMLLLGALLVGGLASIYQPQARYARDQFTTLAFLAAALTLIIILTGALVRGAGASLSCTDWPLCNGAVVPLGQGQGALIHWTHRVAVLGLGITLAMLVWQAWKVRPAGSVRILAAAGFGAYLMQVGVGALYVFSMAADWTGAAHVGFAAITWSLLVSLCVVEVIQTREDAVGETWKLQSEAAMN
jgi:heme A synthase